MIEANGLWIGTRLSPLERACVQSFLMKGHRFNLFVYDAVENVPDGCTLTDAASILPREAIFAHGAGAGAGSLAGFSDRFRYKLLYELGGWWMDLDVLCLQSTFPDLPIVIGRQDPQLINGAVLRFPRQHPAMSEAHDESESKGTTVEWAEIGPKLLTRYVGEGKIATTVLPHTYFYPLHFTQFWSVFDPRRTLHASQTIRGAVCLHLWNEMIRRNGIDKDVLPPHGSLLRSFYEWAIGIDQFADEYRLAPNCPTDSLALERVSRG